MLCDSEFAEGGCSPISRAQCVQYVTERQGGVEYWSCSIAGAEIVTGGLISALCTPCFAACVGNTMTFSGTICLNAIHVTIVIYNSLLHKITTIVVISLLLLLL